MAFECGDSVKWESTSNGSMLEKVGVVMAVIPPGKLITEVISRETAEQLFSIRTDFSGLARNHESCLVVVKGSTGRAKPRLYWPRVSALSKA